MENRIASMVGRVGGPESEDDMTSEPGPFAYGAVDDEDGFVAEDPSVDLEDSAESDDVIVWSRFGDSALPSLSKMPAVNRAVRSGTEFGLPEGFAVALAHAAVDPAELRVLLNRPTRVNIAGGVIEAIDLDLYVPGLVPLPTNNRTIEQRVYPSAGAVGHPGPLTGPRSTGGETSTLTIEGDDVTHVLEEVQRAREYILAKNNLRESIAARGIAMPVNVVFFELRHRDGQPTMPLLGTADGSSRVTNAHEILGLSDAQTTHYHYPTNRDDYRRVVGAISQADPAEARPGALRKLLRQRNALITPARVFLRFTPTGQGYDYARAVNAFVGMLHVDPPRPWSQTGKLEAMAEAVLDVFRSGASLNETVHDYLSGLLTPEQAEKVGLPVERDAQAAFVLATLLREERRDQVERGIRDVTAKKSVSPGRRADVIAELALRSTRSEATTLAAGSPERDRAERMRAAYLRSSHLAGYGLSGWRVTGRSPEELLSASLEELAGSNGDRLQPGALVNRLELVALAQYHLAAWGALRREAMGDVHADKRGPHYILQTMIQDEQGLQLLAQAIVDGRAKRHPCRVDASGKFERGTDDGLGNWHEDPVGQPMPVTDRWLRYEAFPQGAPLPPPVVPPNESPRMRMTRLKSAIDKLVEQTRTHVGELADVQGSGGGSLMDQEGWAQSGLLLSQLMSIHSDISYWGQVNERQMGRTRQDGHGGN